VDAALAAHGYEVDAAELFRAEILAWFMDSPEEEFFGGKYSFKYFEADAMIGAKTPTYWGTVDDSPYRYVANQWSADFIGVLLPAPNLGNTIVFNGDLNHDFQVMAIKTNGSYFSKFKAADVVTAEFLELDSYNRVVVDASGLKTTPREYGLIYLAVIHYGARDGSTARPMYVVDDDVTPPEPLHLGVLQNPLADKYLDIYIFSNEKLYFSSWVDSLPFVQIGLAEQTDTLALESFASVAGDAETNWPKTYIYHGEWVLTADGNYLIVAEGWDIAGNKAPNDTTSVIAKLIAAGTGGMVASEDGSVALSIPPGALARDTYLTLWAVEPGQGSLSQTKPNLAHSPYGWLSPQPKAGISVGWAYRFGPPGRKLHKPALLSIHYGDEDVVGLDESELSIYRLEDSEWVWVGGEVDEATNVITAQVSQLGQYQIHLGRPGAADDDGLTPKTYLLHQNYPNPFNPETEILYALPQSAHVSVTVYNVLGQVVKVLVNEDQPAGSYRAQWDGRSNTGEEVASGIYFYQMQAGDFKATKRMVLMR
ncbi:MAG: T9SS type A sorting domain-containing protein, partial [bacterium]